ncbi:hypothetical protein OKW37_006994 [Paraburkholderia sp. MM5482-R2]
MLISFAPYCGSVAWSPNLYLTVNARLWAKDESDNLQ